MPLTAMAPGALVAVGGAGENTGAPSPPPAGSQKQEVPDYAGKLQHSDGTITDADGNTQQGFAHTSREAQQADPKAPYQMPLTKEEQDIMDGEKGPELANCPFASDRRCSAGALFICRDLF